MRFQKINQVNKKYTTTSAQQTQKLGEYFARVIARSVVTKQSKYATVLALHGNLGGGKTTFLQGFAKGLGVKEKILSPTFVIMKRFENFYHFDCYRINNPEDILELDWKKIISDCKNIIAVEWPEKIEKFLPKNTIFIEFNFIDTDKRDIIIYE